MAFGLRFRPFEIEKNTKMAALEKTSNDVIGGKGRVLEAYHLVIFVYKNSI